MTPERRKDIRFRPASAIVVQCLDTQVDMTLADLGSGGFSVRTGTVLPVGAVMRFTFSTPDGKWTALFTAQSVHSRPDPDAAPDGSVFSTGFKFLNVENPRVAANIHALIDRATAVISFS